MAKKVLLTISLLIGVMLAGSPAQAALTPGVTQPSIRAIAPQLVAEQMAASNVKLTLEDLPPGFQALPPGVANQIASKLDAFKQQLALANVKPEDLSAFVNPETFQVVIGFTGDLAKQQDQASFDASLQQLQKPAVQEQMISLLRKQLKSFGGVEVQKYNTLSDLNKLANASTGFTLNLAVLGQPARMDLAIFRRNTVGAFTAVMNLNDQSSTLTVGDVARKLDSKIVKTSS
ncbi:MAG TPA: hypothetical protein V6D12_07855 [Candidatus Obscuribacterales bacterium]